ncbi:MAG: hypothetical protein LBB94_08050 [Clostridiales bacterium]|jgi:hypothetical protein|nr:hypothetical protein [Clostridiales bacterium]
MKTVDSMKTIQTKFRKGAALPFVVIIFTIVVTVTGIVFAFFKANLKMAVQQEKNIQAYYYTLTGIEMGTAALLMEEDNPAYVSAAATPDVPEKISILGRYQSDPSKAPLIQTISLPNGSVRVEISSPPKPDSADQWIRVEAEGIYIDGGGEVHKNKGSVWYRADNPAISEQDLGYQN